MKISLSDRYKALRRNPKYWKDWEAWQQTGDDKEFEAIAKKLKKKFKVPKLPSHVESLGRLRIKSNPIEVIPFVDPKEEGPNFWDIKTTPGLPPFSEGHKVTLDDFFEDRRYLHLKVDITEPLDKLESAFKDETREWKEKWEKGYKEDCGTKERYGETEEDPWEVFDSITSNGKDLISLAQAKEGINELPSYNKFVGARYKKLSRAYKKAIKMIEEVYPIDE